MNKLMRLTLFALLALFTFAAANAPAADTPRDVDTILADSRIKRMTTVLALTDDQKTKLRPLILDEIKKFKAIRADESLKETDRIQKEKEYRESAKPKFKAILSEEQFTKYEAMQSEKRGKSPAK